MVVRKIGKRPYLSHDKAEDLTIKKLTKGNATMTAKFEDLKNKED